MVDNCVRSVRERESGRGNQSKTEKSLMNVKSELYDNTQEESRTILVEEEEAQAADMY